MLNFLTYTKVNYYQKNLLPFKRAGVLKLT